MKANLNIKNVVLILISLLFANVSHGNYFQEHKKLELAQRSQYEQLLRNYSDPYVIAWIKENSIGKFTLGGCISVSCVKAFNAEEISKALVVNSHRLSDTQIATLLIRQIELRKEGPNSTNEKDSELFLRLFSQINDQTVRLDVLYGVYLRQRYIFIYDRIESEGLYLSGPGWSSNDIQNQNELRNPIYRIAAYGLLSTSHALELKALKVFWTVLGLSTGYDYTRDIILREAFVPNSPETFVEIDFQKLVFSRFFQNRDFVSDEAVRLLKGLAAGNSDLVRYLIHLVVSTQGKKNKFSVLELRSWEEYKTMPSLFRARFAVSNFLNPERVEAASVFTNIETTRRSCKSLF